MASRRRRWVWWTAGTLAFVACVIVAFAAAVRGPYAFLERFHPKRYTVKRGYILMTRIHGITPPMGLTEEWLIFEPTQADEVLAAMQAQLNAAHGFRPVLVDQRTGRPIAGPPSAGAYWSFEQVSPSSAAATGRADSAAIHFGYDGAVWKWGYGPRVDRSPQEPSRRDSACVVILYRDKTWFESMLAEIREILRL